MRRAPNPPASRQAAPRRPVSFKRVFVGVLIAHLLIILGVALFRLPEAKKAAGTPGEPIAMFTPLPAAPAPAKVEAAAPPPAPTPEPPAPAPTPPPPEPQPTPPPPEPTPEPAPAPVPEAPSEIVVPPKNEKPPKPKPETPKAEAPKPAPAAPPAKPAPAPTPAPAKPDKHVPKVNLQEVTHGGAPSAAAKPPAHVVPGATGAGEGPALKPSDISGQLSNALKGSGATKSVPVVGPPGDGGANGNSEYYQLIQRAMYGAWDQPADLAGRHLVAKIEIRIARDGTITSCSLMGTSGNPAFDQSALSAARRVGKLSKPRPDDVPESVAINFQLAD